jgi:hypothetical protein
MRASWILERWLKTHKSCRIVLSRQTETRISDLKAQAGNVEAASRRSRTGMKIEISETAGHHAHLTVHSWSHALDPKSGVENSPEKM